MRRVNSSCYWHIYTDENLWTEFVFCIFEFALCFDVWLTIAIYSLLLIVNQITNFDESMREFSKISLRNQTANANDSLCECVCVFLLFFVVLAASFVEFASFYHRQTGVFGWHHCNMPIQNRIEHIEGRQTFLIIILLHIQWNPFDSIEWTNETNIMCNKLHDLNHSWICMQHFICILSRRSLCLLFFFLLVSLWIEQTSKQRNTSYRMFEHSNSSSLFHRLLFFCVFLFSLLCLLFSLVLIALSVRKPTPTHSMHAHIQKKK